MPYRSNHLAKTARSVSYHKAYRQIAGSVTATILLQQLEYWFEWSKGEPFYKFLERPETNRRDYKEGDSWTEELGFSKDEFRTAFANIGNAWRSKTEYESQENPYYHEDKKTGERLADRLYCSYYDKMRHQTIYIRNHDRVDESLSQVLGDVDPSISRDRQSQSPDIGNPNLPRSENPISIYTETTAEKTAESTTNSIAPKDSKPSYPAKDYDEIVEHVRSTQNLGPYTNIAIIRKDVKRMFDAGYTVEQIKHAFGDMLATTWWQGKTISLKNIADNIQRYCKPKEPDAPPRWYTYLDWKQQYHWESRPGMHFKMTAEEAKDFADNWDDPNKDTFVIEIVEPEPFETDSWIKKDYPFIGAFKPS